MPESVANPSNTISMCSRLLFPHRQVDLTVLKLVRHLFADSESICGLNKDPT